VAPRLASKALHGGETGLLAGVRGRAGCRPFPQGRVLSVHARELLLARGELLALEQAPNQELEVPRQATLQASAGRRATARARVPTSSRGRRPNALLGARSAAAGGGESRQHADLRLRAHANRARSRRQKGARSYGGLRGEAGDSGQICAGAGGVSLTHQLRSA
jgi:hypothetical protein